MVVDHGERVAHLPIAEWEAPLEIHLPDIIRCRMFEASELGRLRGRWDAIVPRQDRMNRRSLRDAFVPILQATPIFRAPTPMGIADLQNGSLDLGRAPGGDFRGRRDLSCANPCLQQQLWPATYRPSSS